VCRIDALHQVLNLDTPLLLAANNTFQQLLVNGEPVEYQEDGETRGDFVRMNWQKTYSRTSGWTGRHVKACAPNKQGTYNENL
jgi:type I restriction enzyme R subunit